MHYFKNTNAGKLGFLGVLILAGLSFWVTPGWGDEEAVAARKIIKQWSEAVITVQITNEQRTVISGRQMNTTENKIEVGATIIDPSGLAVLSLASTDPNSIFSDMFQGREEDGFNFEWKSEIKNIKMFLGDGNEVPAKIVLRDKDLDLAFISPVEKLSGPIPAIDLSRSAKPEISDQIITLERLGKAAGRIPSVSLSRIQAIAKKPRTVYIPDLIPMTGVSGAPVFSLKGKVIGIHLLGIIRSKNTGGMANMMGGMKGMGIVPGILPAAAIMDGAKQALEAVKEKEEGRKKKEE